MQKKTVLKALKVLGRIILKTVIVFAVILVSYALIGLILSLIPVNSSASPDGEVVVYLKRINGFHVDIVMPTRTDRIDWSAIVPPGDTKNKQVYEYLAVGWGSRDFYLNVPDWKDVTPGIALKAISGTGGTALHTRYENEPAEDEDCRRLMLSKDQYDALVEYVLSSGKRRGGGKGAFVRINHEGQVFTDAYYEGTGLYTPFYTCNTWVNSALKTCGQKCCLWTPIHHPIFWKYPLDRQ